jgi:hypothetical protein
MPKPDLITLPASSRKSQHKAPPTTSLLLVESTVTVWVL